MFLDENSYFYGEYLEVEISFSVQFATHFFTNLNETTFDFQAIFNNYIGIRLLYIPQISAMKRMTINVFVLKIDTYCIS